MLLGDEAFLPQPRHAREAHAPTGALDQFDDDLAAAIGRRREIEARVGLRDTFEMRVEAERPREQIFAERGAAGVLQVVIERRDGVQHRLRAAHEDAHEAQQRYVLAVQGVAEEHAWQRAAQAFGAVAADVQPRADILANGVGDPEFPLQHDVALGPGAAEVFGARDEVDEAADQRLGGIVGRDAELPCGDDAGEIAGQHVFREIGIIAALDRQHRPGIGLRF